MYIQHFKAAMEFKNNEFNGQMKAKLSEAATVLVKHLCWSLVLIKLHALRPATLLMRDSNSNKNICERLLLSNSCETVTPTFEYILMIKKIILRWPEFQEMGRKACKTPLTFLTVNLLFHIAIFLKH